MLYPGSVVPLAMFFSSKAPVRLLPCDHTSEDQMVELGRTNGTEQLVSFSLKLQLLPGPGQSTVLASKDEKVQGDGIKACQGENFTLRLFFQTFLFSVRSIVSLRKYMSKIGDCRTSIEKNSILRF